MSAKEKSSSTIAVSTTTAATCKGDTILCFVRAGEKGPPELSGAPCLAELPGLRAALAAAWQSGDFQGRKNQVLVAYPPTVPSDSADLAAPTDPTGPPAAKGRQAGKTRIVVVGLGRRRLDPESWRQAGGSAMARLLKTRAQRVDLLLPADDELAPPELAAALGEGLLLAAYRFRRYLSPSSAQAPAPADNGEVEETGHSDANKRGNGEGAFMDDEPEPVLQQITIHGPRGIGPAMRRASGLAAAVAKARDMANEPGNGWTPADFAAYGRQLGREHGLKVTVMDRKALEKQGLGGILAVNQGSAQPPQLVILEYRGGSKGPASQHGGAKKAASDGAAPTLLLVGKGLTFDSGGISLKPSAGMEEMKYDMCGGAAVMAAMAVIGREKPKGVNVVAMVPATENLPGPAALKPGDIIRPYGGKSVEVINTDAEGRLLLADALAYGVEKFKPAAVVDLATLTGAVIIALGHHYAGLLGNDDELCEKVRRAGERAGEPSWRLPLGPEYRRQLKSRVADLKNVGKRDAGTITAAVFLQEFVGQTPWVHLDIAGTAWNFTEKSYIPKGPSGFGVRTLVELVRHWR